MTLGLTEEHAQLAASVRAWAERHSPPPLVRAAADGDARSYRDSLRSSLAELGLPGLHVPEADGGQGFGLAELAVAIEELGRALVPGSFVPNVLTSAALVHAGQCGKLVAGLVSGDRNGAVALSAGLTGTADGGELVISGTADVVLGAPGADLIVAPVRQAAATIWVALDAADVTISAADSLDLTRELGRIEVNDVIAGPDRVLSQLTGSSVANLAAVILGAEAVGIANWAVTTAAGYAKIREQFGRPIGQFQAVKHRCARMLVAAEQAAAAVWEAARALDSANSGSANSGNASSGGSSSGGDYAAAAAAVLAADAAVSCAHECIQVLGGIGYTWEHDAHLYYRRAMTLRALLGAAVPGGGSWKRRMAQLGLDGARREIRLELPGDGDANLRASIRAELAEIAKLTGTARNAALGAGGWVMPHMPGPWGRGAGAREQLIIDEELRTAGIHVPGLAIGAWVAPALIQYGTLEQQQRFLPATLRADYLWCQLFSEPGAGSDLAGLTTRAVRTEGGWRITGQKIWTSLAKQAAWAICIARTNPAQPRHDGISYFLVDMTSPGIEVRPLREIGGDAFFNEVFLDEVFVPDDCVVGEIDGGWRIARTTLANERVSLSRSWTFGCGVPELLEVARACDQAPLDQVGELAASGLAIDVLAVQAALKQLSGTEPGATGSVRKLLGMRHAQQVAELCWEMSAAGGALGGAGSSGKPVGPGGRPDGAYWARQVLITRALTIGGGTTDIQHNIIGERILGLPRDPDPPAAAH